MTGDQLDRITVDDALQMCSASSNSFTAAEWCYAANILAANRGALVELARAVRAQKEREPGSLDTAIRDALARLEQP